MIKSKKWLISVGLAVVLVLSFTLPSCTGGGGGELASRLNIAVTAMPNTLNMDQLDLQNTNMGTLYLLLVYEPLYCYPKIDEDIGNAYSFAPRLVTDYSWSYEGDNQILTLELQEGVKWHDGEDFTADDVVFSFKSKTISPWAPNMPVNWTSVNSTGYDWCAGDICPDDILVEKDGDYTVKLTYVKGAHQPEAYLPNDFLWYSIVPEHVFGPAGNGTYEGWAENATDWDGEYIGTGPYKVKEYKVDDYILLERNEDYYGDLPAAKEVLFKLYEDENSMWMAFESDDPNSLMDLAISGVPFAKLEQYETDPRINVEIVPDLSLLTLGFNLNTTYGSPFLSDIVEDLPLRQAIAAAINKTKLCDMIAGGYAAPADSWVYLESEHHYGGANNYGVLPNNTYNLTKAADILTDAGYTKKMDGYWYTPGDEKIEFAISSPPGHYDEAALIAEDLQDFGLDVSAPPMDSSTFYDLLYHPNKPGAMEAFVWADDPAPDPWSDWIWCYYADPMDWGYLWNPTWYDVPEFDALYFKNYLATDMETKAEILDEMQLMIAEDIPNIFLMREDIIAACRIDRWENWFLEMGGYATWINEYSIREVTPVPVD